MNPQIHEARWRAFLQMHRAARGFVIPNAWDAGSAVMLASEGFEAIATTSGGIAFSLGRPDYGVSDPRLAVGRERMLAAVKQIVDAVAVPVNADLEAGYGDSPEAVAQTVRLAIDVGAVGGNIEDATDGRWLDEALAVERIAAARSASDATGGGFVLNARCDAFLFKSDDAMSVAIRRANRFLEAGADCVFLPGVTDVPRVRTLAREIAGPLNLVAGLNEAAVSAFELLDAGARRISVGASIARAAMALIRRSARELRDRGTVDYARDQIAHAELNALFSTALKSNDRA